MARTVVIGVQHLLETTGSLVEATIALGLRPERVVLVGKNYSTSSEVLAGLRALGVNATDGGRMGTTTPNFASAINESISDAWSSCVGLMDAGDVDTVVVLDDGGRCIAAVPDRLEERANIVGIEQTTKGRAVFRNRMAVPVVMVASSAVKRFVESPFIAEKVVRVLEAKVGALERQHVGLVGLGNVGGALAKEFLIRGVPCCGFDRHVGRSVRGLSTSQSLVELINKSTLLLGCTGEDILATLVPLDALSGKTLVSCSSEDVEFLSLLMSGGRAARPLDDLDIVVGDGACRVLRGGFPVNFDGTRESVPGDQIQLTRGLLLAGLLQAVGCSRNGAPVTEKLSSELQQLVLRTWREGRFGATKGLHSELDSLTTIAELSGGLHPARGCGDLLSDGTA